ncbi:Microtubule-associated protein TORTIFOLIA1, putative [Ricinus communis]|uniref:Microtubule-associated protein TORTIFOLIA1, putative n=1 Tax=Ricinus communis TaxID=3988 RepID=B9S2H6_RICCO|nr:Microtubule-associated protein TORTIFOLIA1, putative [Ricinus communis]|eukprot:XP_002520195.1 TORTIFOLIA1-like protein 4 [Ricinus communis]
MSLQKRSPPSLTLSTTTTNNDLKNRVISCLNKLSDRDTLLLATTELETIAKTLATHDAFSSFLTCIYNTDSSCRSPVRKHCVNLLTLLSNSHGNSLAPHFSKMISTLTRRLHDPDSAVRAACVEATTAMSSQITKPPFSTLSKPLIEIMTVEKDFNCQIGSALCLAAAIEAAPQPELEMLRKMLPRLGKLVRGDGFKAKAALLSVIGSIVSVGGAKSKGVLDWLMPCLVEFLSCDDWSSRKAAAEVLGKLAVAEKELAKEHKAVCLSCLENRRFDKVKAVRETMNRTLELWKQVPGVSDEVSVPSQSKFSSIDNAISESFPSAPHNSNEVGFNHPVPKKTVLANRSPLSDSSVVTTARKQSPAKCINDNSKTSMFRKSEHKETSAWKIEIALPQDTGGCEEDIKRQDFGGFESGEDVNNGKCRPETKRVLFNSIRKDKLHKSGGFRSGSRVVPCNDDDDCYSKDVEVNNPTEESIENSKDIEDLSLIHDQLIQIENQQSHLLDLLQKFIGSSQHGINSLETRVNGLEMALDEISYDLALSTGRLPNMDSADNTCCKLPGTLCSKFWRRTEGQSSTSRFSFPGSIGSLHAAQNIRDRDARTASFNANSERSQSQIRSGLVISPLRRNSGYYSSQLSSNIIQDDGQVQNAHGHSDC